MTPAQRIHGQMAAISLLVGGLAAADAYLRPGRFVFCMIAVFAMSAVWMTVAIAYRRDAGSDRSRDDRRQIGGAAILAGLMLALALGGALLGAVGIADAALKARIWGVTLGLVLIAVGNSAPKTLSPPIERRCSPARAQAAKRFAGWVFVLAGLGYAAAWLSLAPTLAETVATSLCAGAVALVISRCAWAFRAPRGGAVG
jgi:hypothetical protein